ncbi:MAG: hypothetical protein ACI8R4_001324 [Paracoccaceae bacterium]|jgi:hypothetical protein
MTKWGLVATIKAPATEILEFAAYHLDRGAHRLYLYLDDPNPQAYPTLKAHPKIRVTTCDDAYWSRMGKKRPAKHQSRQTFNATRTYARPPEVDWLIHIDVDEFLWPDTPVGDILGALPAQTQCARVRPIESLSNPLADPQSDPLSRDGTAFKGFIGSKTDRAGIIDRIYPQFGRHVKGGFLSHLAGKMFIRTGMEPLTIKIHNVFLGDEMNPNASELGDIALCHCHATSWDQWISAYRFRLEKGSYRAELAPNVPRDEGGMSIHEVLTTIESDSGETGLRAFYDEFCADTPELRARLDTEGLLRICDLQLDGKRRKHFPEIA